VDRSGDYNRTGYTGSTTVDDVVVGQIEKSLGEVGWVMVEEN
jgi:hypothetical protein